MALSLIEQHYNKHNEQKRLQRRHGQVEFAVSMHHIKAVLEDIGHKTGKNRGEIRIADIGAGAGTYSIELKNMGYDVVAVELCRRNVDFILKSDPLFNALQGDARNMPFLQNDSFDLVILFGPMYHLIGDEQKLLALNEAKRIVRPGGVIMVAYLMNEYSILTYCFAENRMAELKAKGFVDDDFHVRVPEGELYDYARMDDLDRLNSLAGLTRRFVFAPDGASDYMRPVLNGMTDENFALFIEFQTKMSLRADLIGAGSHVVDVLEKTVG